MSPARHPFPVLRWFALVWTLVWFPAYFHYWGWANLLHLCDVAVIVSFAGIWLGSPLLLSSQAVGCMLPGIFWLADVGTRLATGHFLVGGTEYMWDGRYPLWVRLLSAFHVALPVALLYALRRVGYDARGFVLQSGIAILLLTLSRFLSAELNMNYVYRDPVWHYAWAPGALHVIVILGVIILVAYWPTHLLLRRLFPSTISVSFSHPSFSKPAKTEQIR
jgi:hypothetical protein